jgi:hypothetical protein
VHCRPGARIKLDDRVGISDLSEDARGKMTGRNLDLCLDITHYCTIASQILRIFPRSTQVSMSVYEKSWANYGIHLAVAPRGLTGMSRTAAVSYR